MRVISLSIRWFCRPVWRRPTILAERAAGDLLAIVYQARRRTKERSEITPSEVRKVRSRIQPRLYPIRSRIKMKSLECLGNFAGFATNKDVLIGKEPGQEAQADRM